MLCRVALALLLVSAGTWASPKPQDTVETQIIRGPDIVVEEKPVVQVIEDKPEVKTEVISVLPETITNQDTLPPNEFLHIGCYRDNGQRDLPKLASNGANSAYLCSATCRSQGFNFAGLQYSTECWCGHEFGRYGVADNCNMKCSADNSQTCGGGWANNVLWTGLRAIRGAYQSNLIHLGCFRDNGQRDLPKLASTGPNTPMLCRLNCYYQGFNFAGTQASGECWCGNEFGRYGAANNCNMRCSANNALVCGGAWANNIYWTGRTALAGGIYQARLRHLGCFRDNGVRDLPKLVINGVNSIQLCRATCYRQGFKYAGVQNSAECWCGNSYGRFGQADNCNMRCSANNDQICGGGWANNVYVATP